MKAILAALVVVGSALTGRAMAVGHARRARLLSRCMDALHVLRVRMLEGLLPVGAALRASDCAPLRRVGEGMGGGAGAEAAWGALKATERARGGLLDCLSEEDLRALDALFAGLGMSGRSEQEQLFGAAMRELGRMEHAARKKSGESARLYTTLGVLGGLALTVGLL